MAAFEQHVVAEQVGVQVGAGQGEEFRSQLGDFRQAVAQQRQLILGQAQRQARPLLLHPIQAAVAGAFEDVVAGGQMQTRQQPTDFGAMVRVGLDHVLAGQSRLQQRGLLRQLAQGLALFGA